MYTAYSQIAGLPECLGDHARMTVARLAFDIIYVFGLGDEVSTRALCFGIV